MSRPFEKVYAVYKYYDSPRSGVADFDCKPHYFENLWDEEADDYASTFKISPISDDTLKLVIEDWNMWLRWRAAFKEGKLSIDYKSQKRPTLPADETRYNEIAPLLKDALSCDPARQIITAGSFRYIPFNTPESIPPSELEWEVCWNRDQKAESKASE